MGDTDGSSSAAQSAQLKDIKSKRKPQSFIARIAGFLSFGDLQQKPDKTQDLEDLKIFPINVGKDNLNKASSFFNDLKIRNLNLYFDNPETLAKKLSLRGIPTTILFNKKGDEFARIVGSIDFSDQKFLDWLKQYN